MTPCFNMIPVLGELYLNGDHIANVKEITKSFENETEIRTLKFTNPIEFTMSSVKYGKLLRCKTRKRFIKLLMSKGVSRNNANKVALFVRIIRRESYDVAWKTYYFTGGV